jgi:hypothetical protein
MRRWLAAGLAMAMLATARRAATHPLGLTIIHQ